MFAITGGSAVEPTGSGSASVQFMVTRSGGTNSQVTIGYTTVDGTATANRDYAPTTGTVTFPVGATTEPITIPIFDNGVYDNPNLTFSVELTGITDVEGPPAAFGAQNNVVSTSSPVSVAVGDVNGDGRPDLVVTYYFNDSVSVLLNTTPAGATTPTFAAPVSQLSGFYPTAVALADVNGDGLPDLVVLNAGFYGGHYVSVLLNTTKNGVFSFAPHSSQATFAVGYNPTSLAVADLNGDGKPDLVIGDGSYAGTVTVLLNTTAQGANTPSFSASTYSVGAYPRSVAVADLNGDGKPDLVVANGGSNDVSVLANTTTNGVLSFAAPQTLPVGYDPVSVAVADINGDGAPDLIVANYDDNTVSVLLNTTAPGAAAPTFAAQTTFATGVYPASVAVADVNGDGKPDLVVANSKYDSYSISVLVNTTPAGAAAPTFAPQATIATTPAPLSVVIADLNGDGQPDLAITATFGGGDPYVATFTNTTPVDNPLTITQPTAVGTIIESDPPPTVQFNAASETVDASAGAFSITVGLSAVSDADTTIPFALGGTAVNGTDYTINSANPLVIPAGQTSGVITGTLFNNSSTNATQTLTFTLGTPTNATLGATTMNTLTIQNTAAIGVLTLTPNGYQVTNDVPRVAAGDAYQQGGYFTDVSNEPVTAVINWGDGSITTAPVVVENQVGRFVTDHVYARQGSYPLSAVIVDSQGQVVAAGALPGPVQVVPYPFGPVNVIYGVPGQTVSQYVTDPTTGTIIDISLTLPAGSPAGAYLLVTQLLGVKSPTTADVLQNIASFDIRQFDLPANATATVTLIVASDLPPGTMGQLFYQDLTNPANPINRVFQGPTLFFNGPNVSFSVNQFTTPKLTDLTGTIFTIAASVPAATVTASVSPLVASTASTPVPVQTASFQSTSELTLTLEASQASQVSSGLSTLTTNAVDGGGGGGNDEGGGASSAAAALLQFLLKELDYLPKLLNLYESATANPAPPAPATATPTAAGPQSNAAPSAPQENLSALDLFLRDPTPAFGAFESTISVSEINGISSTPRIDVSTHAAPAKAAVAYTAAAVGAGLYISEREKRRNRRQGLR